MPRWTVTFNVTVDTRNAEVLQLVANVNAFAKVIRNIPIPPGIQKHLDALNIMRAVRGTTGIEGTELSEQEVINIMQSPKNKPVLADNRKRDEQEARNAETLMRYISMNLVKDPGLPISEQLICHIHEILTSGVNYPGNTPGKYRTYPVSVDTYVPPATEDEVRKLMTEFITWLNEGPPKAWDLSIRAIIAHFYLVSIHPFADGNGRTSRGLESFLLYKAGINARGFYSLANYYYQNRTEYIQMLDHVRFETSNDLTPFVLFALRGLSSELEAVHSEVLEQVTIIAYRDYVRETLEINNKLRTPSGERMFHFLQELSAPVSLRQIRGGRHPLSRYYKGLSAKTLTRDVNFFLKSQLVVIDGDKLLPNVQAMVRFMPPST